jgi:hypothetical protein
VPNARGGNLLGRLTLQLGSLGAFPTRILRLPELLVRIGQKRMSLRRLRIHLRRQAQFPQRARRIALPEKHLAISQIGQKVIRINL